MTNPGGLNSANWKRERLVGRVPGQLLLYGGQGGKEKEAGEGCSRLADGRCGASMGVRKWLVLLSSLFGRVCLGQVGGKLVMLPLLLCGMIARE